MKNQTTKQVEAYKKAAEASQNKALNELDVVGTQGQQALIDNQGNRGQGVSDTSLLVNNVSTGTAQAQINNAYEQALQRVQLDADRNVADYDRAMAHQQVDFDNRMADLETEHQRNLANLERDIAHQQNMYDINLKTNIDAMERDLYATYGTGYTTIKAYNKAIKTLAKDGDPSNDWKVQYLTNARNALQTQLDEQNLANAKNSFSASLSQRYTTVADVDKAIKAILSDGDTSNDWQLTYLNKYRTVLNRLGKVGSSSGSSGSGGGRSSGSGGSGGTTEEEIIIDETPKKIKEVKNINNDRISGAGNVHGGSSGSYSKTPYETPDGALYDKEFWSLATKVKAQQNAGKTNANRLTARQIASAKARTALDDALKKSKK